MLAYFRKRCSRHENTIADLRMQLAKERARNCFTKASRNRGYRPKPQQLRLSVSGGYRLAIRRNIGHIGQRALAKLSEASVGRQAIGRAEIRLATFFTIAARTWCTNNYAYLDAVKARVANLIISASLLLA
jgi:hypothetical protein